MDDPDLCKSEISFSTLCLFAVLGLAAITLPVFVWFLDLPIFSDTYGTQYRVIEFFGLFASIALVTGFLIKVQSVSEKHHFQHKITPKF